MLTQEIVMTEKESANKNHSRVFLIAQPTIPKNGQLPDLTPLADFGDIKVVIEAGDYPSFKPGEAWKRVNDRLRDFDAEQDYLVWAGGDTLSSVMAGAALTQMGHRRFRWLRFERGVVKSTGERDNLRGKYSVVEISLL